MKAPVCEICLKSGILCRSCEERFRKGEVSPVEVKVAGLLLKLSGDKKMLRDVTLVRVADDMREFIGNIIKPVHVLSISKLYKEGREVLKVVTGNGKGPRISPKDFGDVIRMLYGKEAEIGEE
jgi:transcription antitermination factor NusA-like protein